jgi:hypothetical protein
MEDPDTTGKQRSHCTDPIMRFPNKLCKYGVIDAAKYLLMLSLSLCSNVAPRLQVDYPTKILRGRAHT